MSPSSKVGTAMAGPTGPVPPGLTKIEKICILQLTFSVMKTLKLHEVVTSCFLNVTRDKWPAGCVPT